MADDPRTYVVNPQEDPSAVWSIEWAVGSTDVGVSSIVGSQLFLLPDGRIVAANGTLTNPDARRIALRQTE